ncbi:MAG: AAA family ATPase [Capsulimonadaceae bacterium]
MNLILENIRCFAGYHDVPIKPLTLLVGENSSGKSTFLAALAAVCDYGFPLRLRLNTPPYSLGNYDTIATYKGGRFGRADSFALGTSTSSTTQRNRAEPGTFVARYRDRRGLVEISEIVFDTPAMNALLKFGEASERRTINIEATIDKSKHSFEFDYPASLTRGIRNLDELLFNGMYSDGGKEQRRGAKPSQADQRTLQEILFNIQHSLTRRRLSATSIAPIRTKPERTYDKVTEEFTPEGDHIPFVLSRVLANVRMREAFERFGHESGLFEKVAVKQLGSKVGDPIQVMVTNTSRPANLLDVGYGVSQSLPVIVESMLSESSYVLLQQPEVHLHPRAQAALGSFLVNLIAEKRKGFVVETHSDYIIDRVRLELSKGNVLPEDVCLLYFEKREHETSVQRLSLDERGNIVDAPPTYREFFLREELSLLRR